MIRQMCAGFISIDSVQESDSCCSKNPFRIVLKTKGFNIGNLNVLKGRGFELLCFGITDEGKLYIDFDVAAPKVRA
jgi:hypothetical protein